MERCRDCAASHHEAAARFLVAFVAGWLARDRRDEGCARAMGCWVLCVSLLVGVTWGNRCQTFWRSATSRAASGIWDRLTMDLVNEGDKEMLRKQVACPSRSYVGRFTVVKVSSKSSGAGA